jgi:F-type H+-transporting ATPase subunit delta
MVEDRIGFRYAKAAFDLGRERDILDQLIGDMKLVQQLSEENRDFALFIKSPLVSPALKEATLDRVFDGRFQTDLGIQLVRLMVQKGREAYLPTMAASFIALYDEVKKIRRGHLVSALPLPSAVLDEIKDTLEKQSGYTHLLSEEVDEALIGGFILKVGNRQFDGSVASSIRKIKRSFAGKLV